MAEILLHVGLSKSGTTALQNLFFARHPGLQNIGKPDYTENPRMLELRRWVMGEGSENAARAAFQACVAPLRRQGRTIVLSEENFSAVVAEQRNAAMRLKDLFGEAKILITVREPVAMLESLYVAWLTHAGKRYPYLNIDAWLDQQWARWNDKGDSYLFRVDGARLAEIYAALFGAERVTVMPFEQLKVDADGFCRSLADLAGLTPDSALDGIIAALSQQDVNQRKSAYSAGIARLPLQGLRPFIPPVAKKLLRSVLDRGKPAQAQMSDASREKLQEWSKPANRRLRDGWGLEAEQHGYAV